MAQSCACKCLNYIAAFLQIALAVIIIVLVAVKLEDVTFPTDMESLKANWAAFTADPLHFGTIEAQCSLGTSLESSSLCVYTYVLAGLSLVLTFLISMLKFVTCDLCGLGGVLDIIFAAVGTAWWSIGASIVTTHAQEADQEGLPQQDYRNAVVGLMWAEVVAFGVLLVSGTANCAGKMCCHGGGARFQKLEA